MAHVPAAERRTQLIRAAVELMAREGIAAGSTRAIAAELGVGQAIVHYVFGSKEELYRAVMEQLTEDLVHQVEQAVPDRAGFEETLTALAHALWQTVRDQPTSHQILNELSLFAVRTPHLREALESHYRRTLGSTSRLIAEAAGRTGQALVQPPKAISRFFLAGFEGLSLQRLAVPDDQAETAALQALVEATTALATGRLGVLNVP